MKVIIVGAGIAGIATSVRLAQQGFQVEVYEAGDKPGGKIREFVKDGFRFDAGPSLLTLPSLIDELFTLCDRNPADWFRYHQLSVVCKYFYPDGTLIKAYADKNDFSAEVNRATGEPQENVLNYLTASEALYNLTAPVFLQQSLHTLSSYLKETSWKAFFRLQKLDAFKTLHQRNISSFRSGKVVQLFDRYATYNGSDPFKAPATLKVIPHLEYNQGAFFPEGGIYQVVDSLFRLAGEMGVRFHFNAEVKRILVSQGKVEGIQIGNETVTSQAVVSNADIHSTYKKLLPDIKLPAKVLNQQPSSSALVFYWGINRTFPELDLHNIFFSKSYESEFDALTNQGLISNDPTVYLNISSKMQYDDAPPGCENWFVMINAPYIKGQDWDNLVLNSRKAILRKLTSILQIDISSHIISESILSPADMEARTFSHLGSLYGSSSNSRFSAFLRHKNFSSEIRDMYFCGGSVHPGGGIPLCLLSAKIVSELLLKRHKRPD